MSEIPIRPEALEAAVVALYGRPNEKDGPLAAMEAGWPENARLAIAAFCEAEGLTVDDDDGHNECYRLVSGWKEKQESKR
jgi:hypothetical protein